jgi:hypothetical protein
MPAAHLGVGRNAIKALAIFCPVARHFPRTWRCRPCNRSQPPPARRGVRRQRGCRRPQLRDRGRSPNVKLRPPARELSQRWRAEGCDRSLPPLLCIRAHGSTISYRIGNGFDHFKIALSIRVMKMVCCDEAASGAALRLDTAGS